MKKKEVKWAIKIAFQEYYDKGLTNTAASVKARIFKELDKIK